MANYQDFQLINNLVQQYPWSCNWNKFMRFFFNRIYWLGNDEIDTTITDKNYVTQLYRWDNTNNVGDSWIDGIYIDENAKEIHILNFKYKDAFDGMENHFEWWEIPKIKEWIEHILEKNEVIERTTNINFIGKTKEIWELMGQDIYKIKIFFVTNGAKEFTEDCKINMDGFVLAKWETVSYEFILLTDLVNYITDKKYNFSWKFRAIEKNYFDKSWPSVRTFVCELTAKDLIRMSLSDSNIRMNPDSTNQEIRSSATEELIFDSNVRGYLKQRWEINKNIKDTALKTQEAPYFFYYNNGITILCDRYNYNPGRSPLVELTWIQIVNWSQTIHSLKDAFDENSDNFDDITILTRIYETQEVDLYRNIAKFTNSQNAVTWRDLKANDWIHTKIKEFLQPCWINYIIKRGDIRSTELINIEIDLLGQILMSWKLELPWEAKNKKSLIFWDKYVELFGSNLSLEEVNKLIWIYNLIEEKKIENRPLEPFLAHASFYILFFIKKFKETYPSLEVVDLYTKTISFIRDVIINREKIKQGDDYSDAVLFKWNKPKEYISEIS